MPVTNLHIKAADISSTEVLAEISASTFYETFSGQNSREDMDKYMGEKFSRSQITAELNDKKSNFFIALSKDKPVGYVKLAVKQPVQLQHQRSMEIERIYVLKEFQDRKIGAALMQFSLAYATEHEFDLVWLGVWEHNPKAIHFYEQWGFEKFGTHIFVLGNDQQTDILMKKDLQKP